MNKKDLIRLRNQLARDFKQLEKCSDKTIKVITKNGTVKNIPSVQLRDYYPKEGIRKLASKPKRIFDTVFTYSKRAKLRIKNETPSERWMDEQKEFLRTKGPEAARRFAQYRINKDFGKYTIPGEKLYDDTHLPNMRKAVPESERIALMPDGTHKRELLDTSTGLPIHPKDESNAIERLYQGWLDRIGDKVSLKEFVDGLPHEERVILRNVLKENYGDLEHLLIDSVFTDNVPEGATSGNLTLSIDINKD